ncbi:nitrogenase [Oculatella sp. FACHB-28]|uniref:Mo-dependent nitrogenase C-terminal domain-containing protein n=1 Tax=Cyanophyceae TaxID=3028117 RepID=UPI001684F4EA|nr:MULTISPECIES: Mo-dependent nitrogenase C-terminal domain-containing protein [Cyanophyceae]MBD2000693.1 nitrogenase [Leptolyngbya sp. FACHB-541]MBD2056784.1 nitrogenase [Oculatella sp. FACHB-28]MBD2066939.1 nitrogenase [Leptolyngbya sp. FACHB-671]
MASAAHLYTSEQISVWLRGLLTIAWADGHFDQEEKDLIASLTQDELDPKTDLGALEPIAANELAAILGNDAKTAENFLRTAVMVAIADGTYSSPEDQTLRQFCQALGQPTAVLETLCLTLPERQIEAQANAAKATTAPGGSEQAITPLRPVREWLDQLEIADPRVARFLCKMIPSQCPFERDVNVFGHKVVHIPPLCKLNPLYEQLVGLRFRALSYLADDCGEDVTPYY